MTCGSLRMNCANSVIRPSSKILLQPAKYIKKVNFCSLWSLVCDSDHSLTIVFKWMSCLRLLTKQLIMLTIEFGNSAVESRVCTHRQSLSFNGALKATFSQIIKLYYFNICRPCTSVLQSAKIGNSISFSRVINFILCTWCTKDVLQHMLVWQSRAIPN